MNNRLMARYGIEADVALRLATEAVTVHKGHQLVAAGALRSRVLGLVYASVRRGEQSRAEARTVLDRLTSMRIRLLADRVSRAVAWEIAEQLDWDDISMAEYIAVAKLQADAFVTLDAGLARQVDGIVAIAPFEALISE